MAVATLDGEALQIEAMPYPTYHDDTLKGDGLATDPLGINTDTMSAANVEKLKRLLGVDETVLYDNQSGSATSSISLTESPMNFEKVKVYFGTPIGTVSANSNIGVSYTEVLTRTFSYSAAAGHGYLTLNGFFYGTNSNQSNPYFTVGQFTGCNTTTWTQGASGIINKVGTTTSSTNPTWIAIHKIVGIHRIAGGNN